MSLTPEQQHELKCYQEFTPTTAVYPAVVPGPGWYPEWYKDKRSPFNPLYLACEVVGESREVLESEEYYRPYKLGDVLWPTSQLANALGLSLSELHSGGQPIVQQKGYGDNDLLWVTSAILEPVKKLVRDGDAPERLANLITALAPIVWMIDAEAWLLDMTIADIAHLNRLKLESRQKRGVIHGKGDQ